MNPPTNQVTKKYNNKEWTVMFEKLQAYKSEHNTCNVPKRYQSDPKLGHWVHYQRTMMKANKLSPDRKELLEGIGFVWSERQSSSTSREQTSWDERFQELKRFQSIHGHCKVPRKGPDAALGRWVKWQRWNRTLLDRGESSVLTKKKIKLLNSIGFSWGYQRVPPPKKTGASSTDVSIEPLPYMPEEGSANTKQDSRKNVVTPPFSAASVENHVKKGTRNDRGSSSTRFGESNNFTNQEVNVPKQFNPNELNFTRPSMSPLDDDFRFDRQDNNGGEFSSQFQGFSMNRLDDSNSFKTYGGLRIPYNAEQQQIHNQIEEMKRHVTATHVAHTKVWKCSVCRYASFDTYDEALTHENDCNGFPEGAFCRACAA